MAKIPHNTKIKLITRPPSSLPKREKVPMVVMQPNGGIVTQQDPNDIKENQYQLGTANITIRNDVTSRLPGSILYTPAKPNALKILRLVQYQLFGGTQWLMRHTASTLHKSDGVNWTNIVIAPALTGLSSDRVYFTQISDGYYFTNSGKDPIQSVNIGANTCAPLGNAPAYKYIANCFNRIVGANLGGGAPNAVQVGWSGDTNFPEWNPAVDISAGFTPITESGSDLSDPITGLEGYTWGMIIPRERSIWVATKQPIATQPFFFYNAAPSIGCDCPGSVANIPNGIAFLSIKNNNVFIFQLNPSGTSQPIEIGTDIRNALTSRIDNINNVFSSYNGFNNEYTIGVLPSGSLVASLWTYNFYNKGWSYSEIPTIFTLSDNEYPYVFLAIEDLLGSIADLAGPISALGVASSVATKFYPRTDGDIWVESALADTNPAGAYTTRVVSKNFTLPINASEVANLDFEIVVRKAGNFNVSYSKDGGDTWTLYRNITTVNGDVGKKRYYSFKKAIYSRLFTWKVESTSGLWDITKFEGYMYQSGEARTGK